jgi:hypothetical protein
MGAIDDKIRDAVLFTREIARGSDHFVLKTQGIAITLAAHAGLYQTGAVVVTSNNGAGRSSLEGINMVLSISLGQAVMFDPAPNPHATERHRVISHMHEPQAFPDCSLCRTTARRSNRHPHPHHL